MVKTILITKNCEIKSLNIQKVDIETFYKKCKFGNNKNFKKQTTWKWNDNYISLFAKQDGRVNSENKYDLPPPLDKELFYGLMLICAHTEEEVTNDNIIDFNIESWTKLYEELF